MADAVRAEIGDNSAAAEKVGHLRTLAEKVLWLASWTIHNANHLRPNADGVKVGGHQASSASCVQILTALYLDALRPDDRVAVKPHASPVFHALQYLLGNQTRENLERFRALGGAQSYPSRTKDTDDVDFSTGSVGLGAAMASFAALTQEYLRAKGMDGGRPAGRMVALVGDAELDEGNIYECLLEGLKHDIRNVWWIIDYNRQSLDAVISDRLSARFDALFQAFGWRVITLKYGRKLEAAFTRTGGAALRRWIDECPNSLYAALTFQGGAAWRRQLLADIGEVPGIRDMLDAHDDARLGALMTNLGGHDLELLSDTFAGIADDRPTCLIAYTIKGFGLPLAGHKDNHAGLMTPDQMAGFRTALGVPEGREWDRFGGIEDQAAVLQAFLDRVPFNAEGPRRRRAPSVSVPDRLPVPVAARMSTQDGFGKILHDIAREDTPFARRLVTTSPDVTVSTNLGPWVNRRGVFSRHPRDDVFKSHNVASAQRWALGPEGQHIELGIAENNLFLLLAALGLSHSLFGERLLPIGTLYDPFIQRGLDALNYACYQDARFLLVATPSGVTLAPEGGAHQSIGTPLIGMAQDGLASFEPAFVDELAVILRWAFAYMQHEEGHATPAEWLRDVDGGSVYLRLSTRTLDQPDRAMSPDLERAIIQGGYWLVPPEPGADLAIAYTGAVAPDARAAFDALREDVPGAGLLAVTSADRLNAGWLSQERARRAGGVHTPSWLELLLSPLAADAGIVTVVDGHPNTLGWIGAARGHRTRALGVEHFGQTGTVADVYKLHGLDADAILDAAANLCVDRVREKAR